MNDPVINLALIGRLLRHRWPLLLVVAVFGALAGFGSSFALSPGYVSTAKILLGGERDPKQLPGEVQIATSLVVLDKTAEVLGRGATGIDLQDRVSAEVDGNVIAISGAAPTPEQAQQLAQEASKQYIAFSTQIVSDAAAATADASKASRDAVQKRIDDANDRITALLASPAATSAGSDGTAARAEIEQEKATVTQASKDLDQIDGSTESSSLAASLGRSTTRVIESPSVPESPASPTQVELIAAGAVLALVVAVFAHLMGLRSDRRLREPGDVAAALGAPVLGQFDVDEPATRRSLPGRVLHDDRRWTHPAGTVAEDDRGRAARGERVVRRLVSGTSPLNAVLLTFDDDPAARSAVPGLAVAAARLAPVTVVTTDDEVATAVRSAAADEGVAALVTVAPSATPGGNVLRYVSFPPGRPAVPEVEGDPAIVLAVTAGRRTGWELTSVVAACTDVGHALAGCVLLTPRGRGAGGTAKTETAADSTDRAALAGSS